MADRLRSWLRRRQPIERSALPVPSSGGKTYNAFMSYSHAVDNKFAPTLQRALQRFAKPWFRRQALRVFRDEESLSANPGLWSSIQLALDSAEFFILLASPESARSRWVDREVAYWLAHKPEQKLLIAVTGGEVIWDDRAGDFDWEQTTALPPSLRGQFSEEPRYIDFSWARTEQHISLRHTLFRDRVADLAAPLHHRPKDDLVGEEIRQHHRTLRLVRSTVALLTVLALLAGGFAIRANNAANEERRQRNRAETQLRLATARYLAARAVSEGGIRYAHSLLLSLASLAITDSAEGRSSLLTNLQRNPKLEAFWQHPGFGSVAVLAFSPNGRVLASGATNDEVTIWDTRTGRARCRLSRPYGNNIAEDPYVAISSRGVLAAGTQDGQIVFGDPRSCRLLRRTRESDDVTGTVAFSPDGRTLASAGTNGQVTLWNATTFRREGRLKGRGIRGRNSFIGAVTFSPDGRTLASATSGGYITLWDYRSRRPIGTLLHQPEDAVEAVAFSPDGKILAAGDSGGYIALWDTRTRKRIREPLWGNQGLVTSLAFSSDDQTLASAGTDGNILLWDVTTGELSGEPLLGHDGAVEALAFSPDGRMLASGGHDGTLIWWGLETTDRLAHERQLYDHSLTASAFSANSRILALASRTTVLVWNVNDPKAVPRKLAGHGGLVTSLAVSADGRTLAAGDDRGSIVRWDVEARKPIGSPLRRHTGRVSDMVFSPDGKTLASSGYDGRVIIWDAGTGQVKAQHEPLKGELDPELDPDFDDMEGVAFSPDGKTLAAVGHVSIFLWETGSASPLGRSIDAHAGALFDVTFSSDGRTLAAASLRSVTLWDVKSSKRVGGPLMSRGRAVYEVEFAPDGKAVVGAREDRSFALWSAEGIQLGAPTDAQNSFLNTAAISPDGLTGVAGTSYGSVILWDLDIRSWQDRACSIVNANLSREEWTRLVGSGIPYIQTC